MASWVCPECGLDYDTISPPDGAVAVRSFPRRFRERVEAAGDVLRERSAPATWSALEYTAHVADVTAWMADSIERMRTETNPTISFPDPDELAARERYNQQDPAAVLARLKDACDRLAATIERFDPDDWERTATFDWGERDALTMMRNAVHEGAHHLRDIERGLARLGAGES